MPARCSRSSGRRTSTEGIAYNQFIPPLTESLEEVREVLARVT